MPIYRYRCTECGHEIEVIQELSEEKPDTKEIEHEQRYDMYTRQCPGVYKRMYDTFQFHISGR